MAKSRIILCVVQTRPHLSLLYNGSCSDVIASCFSAIWYCGNTEKSLKALIVCSCRFPGLWSLGGGRWRMSEILHSFRLHSSAATQPHTAVNFTSSSSSSVDQVTYEVTHFISALHYLSGDRPRTQIHDFPPNWNWRKLHNSSSSASLSVTLSNIFKSSVQASEKLEARPELLIIRFPCNAADRFLTSLIVFFFFKQYRKTPPVTRHILWECRNW